jgi:hypothetical protein
MSRYSRAIHRTFSRNTKTEKHGGSIFSAGSLLGDSSLNGSDSSLYTPDVSIDNPVDNSQYDDTGTDPTSGGGGDFLSTLSTVANDAFKAYTVSQTPTSYRAAAPGSPAAIAARAAAAKTNTSSTLLIVGGLVVVVVVLFLVFRK